MSKRFVLLSLLCLSLLGCSTASEAPSATEAAGKEAPASVAPAPRAPAPPVAQEAEAHSMAMKEASSDGVTAGGGLLDNSSVRKSAAAAPKLIKNGAIQMRVEKYKEARSALARIAAAHQAYIAREEEKTVDGVPSNRLVLRVSAERFDALLDAVAALAAHVQSRTVNVSDVSEEYVDLQARLKAKRAVEAQYQEILKQAKNVREILDVEQYLRQVQEEIEAAEGRLRFLDSQVSLSTIEVTMFEQPPSGPRPDPASPGFFERLWTAVERGWASLLRLAIDMVEDWPAWLLFFALVWLAWRLVRKGLATHARRRESRPAYWPGPPPAPWAPYPPAPSAPPGPAPSAPAGVAPEAPTGETPLRP